jgi:hypothetical protein
MLLPLQIQCTSCYSAYHPLCGRLAGLHMNIDDGTAADGSPDAAVRLVSYCARHCTPHPELSGASVVFCICIADGAVH